MRKIDNIEIEDLIVESSNTDSVDLQIDDRTIINHEIVSQLVPSKNYRKKKANKFFKIFTPIATSLVVVIIAVSTLPFIFVSNSDFTFKDKDLYNSVITKEQLLIEIPNIKLPKYALDISDINLYKTIAVDELIYTELNYCNTDLTKLKLSIVFVDNYQIKNFQYFTSLEQNRRINDYNVSYSILVNHAFATFKNENYLYFLEYESSSPTEIIDIISSI